MHIVRGFTLLYLLVMIGLVSACHELAVTLDRPESKHLFKGIDKVEFDDVNGNWIVEWSEPGDGSKRRYQVLLEKVSSLDSSYALKSTDLTKHLKLQNASLEINDRSENPSGVLVGVVEGGSSFVYRGEIDPTSYYIFEVLDEKTRAISARRVSIASKIELFKPSAWYRGVSDQGYQVFWDKVEKATQYEITGLEALGILSSSTTSITIDPYDARKAYSFCVRPVIGALRSSECLEVSIPAAAADIAATKVTSSIPNGAYRAGDSIPLLVHFDRNVSVANASGLFIRLITGNGEKLIPYASGSGGTVLSFNYAVANGDDISLLNATELVATSPLTKIADEDGLYLPLALPAPGSGHSLAEEKSILIDTLAPLVPSAVSLPGAVSTSSSVVVTWTPGYDVNFQASNLKLCADVSCSLSCVDEAETLSSPATKTGLAGQSYYACVQSKDKAGNLSTWVSSATSISILNPPVFAGVASGDVLGSWPDGKAKVELTFAGLPSYVSQYRVYFSSGSTAGSFNFSSPLATINVGDATFDSNPTDNKVLLSVPSETLVDGYYIVRYYDASGNFVDSNTNISTVVNVLKGQPGYVLIPKVFSGLSYDYFLMRYEASFSATGSNGGGDSVSTTPADLAICSYKFHVDGLDYDASCGNRFISYKAQSRANVLPQTNVKWPEAFHACRNASSMDSKVRMPTATEWKRAARWIGTNYATMWATYSDKAATHCYVDGATAASTGTASTCMSSLGVYDMAGNVREWVDHRMIQYVTPGGEARFGHTPTLGVSVSNGIDNIVQRFHTVNPGVNGLALTLGADFKIPTLADRKQYGADVQTWSQPDLGSDAIGFRCAGFRADTLPTMNQLSLPDEPKFSASDLPALDPANWKIPENLFIKDNKWESVRVSIDAAATIATPTVAHGTITLTWTPWLKTVCDNAGACSSSDVGLIYKVYRFVEPNRSSIRTAVPWALSGAGSAYANDKALDPIAMNALGQKVFDATTSDGKLLGSISNCLSASPASCSFVDGIAAGTGFATDQFYNYILTVTDASGNEVVPQVQTFRSPYFAGDSPIAGASSFRMEPRFRRASVFALDDTYQQALTNSQIMSLVSMDVSGLDHDFYIQKFEPVAAAGSIQNSPANSGAWPLQASGATWISNAARCYDAFLQTGSLDAQYCGSGGVLNDTTAIFLSKAGVTPSDNVWQGTMFKGCRASTMNAGGGFVYKLGVPSDPEWLKASDWGDTDQDGTVDANPFVPFGTTISQLEGNGIANSCNTSGGSRSLTKAASTAKCFSRHGVEGLVGNVWEWTSGQVYNGVGLDNGIDGLWLGQLFPTSTSSIQTIGAKYDLLRAVPLATGASSIPHVNDSYTYGSGLRGSYRSGSYGMGDSAGRWLTYFGFTPSQANSSAGGRCSR